MKDEKDKTLPIPDVFKFLDYREYLKAFYNYKREINPLFSHRVFARICGFNTLTYLNQIIGGSRNLTQANSLKVALACGLNRAQQKYFICLVKWNQCTRIEDKEIYWKELIQYAPGEDNFIVQQSQAKFLAYWQSTILLEMRQLKDFRPDQKWFTSRFRCALSKSDLNTIMEMLESSGLLSNNQSKQVQTSAPSELIRRFHHRLGEVGLQALYELDFNEREFGSVTLAIRNSQWVELKEEIEKFKHALLRLANADRTADDVLHVNIQCFPMTKKNGVDK